MSHTILSSSTVSLSTVSEISYNSRTITSNTTLNSSDDIIYIGLLTGNITLTLPDVSTVYDGKRLLVIMTDMTTGNYCSITCGGSDTYEDGTTYLRIYNSRAEIVRSGTTWTVFIGNKYISFLNNSQAGPITVATNVDIIETPSKITSNFCTAASDVITFSAGGRYNIYHKITISGTAATDIVVSLTNSAATVTYVSVSSCVPAGIHDHTMYVNAYNKIFAVNDTLKSRIVATAPGVSTLGIPNDDSCIYIEKL